MASPGELYQSYMRGWRDGATAKAKRREFIEHAKPEFRTTYEEGYEAGMNARGEAGKHASKTFGYTPSILR